MDLALANRSLAVVARLDGVLSNIAGLTGTTPTPALNLRTVREAMDQVTEKAAPSFARDWWVACATLARLLELVCARRDAAILGEGSVLEATARIGVVATEVARSGVSERTQEFLSAVVAEGRECDWNPVRLASSLRAIPLPTLYNGCPSGRETARPPRVEARSSPRLLRVIAFLNDTPIASAQQVRVNEAYSLRLMVKGSWPEASRSLSLRFISSTPSDLYSASSFELEREPGEREFEGEVSGHLTFRSPTSLLGDPFTLRLTGAYRESSGTVDTRCLGYVQFRFRVVDPRSAPLASGYPRIDLHVADLLEELRRECPAVEGELQDLIPLLQGVTALLGMFAQEGVFKGVSSLSERKFQQEVARYLRMRLGKDLQEHTGQAGGITDIRFRGVIVELKVESCISDRAKIAAKYSAQLAQYEGIEARQVGILLVLDLTRKAQPTGDIRNNILLVEVPTHGSPTDRSVRPSKAIVFVVDGNTRSPSSYSR